MLVVSNDKDMMQLVDANVRVLRAGTGGAKNDVIVDAAKVEEILGVPPEKVVDVMALMGDTIDNIPGAKDPNEKPPEGERRKAGIGEVGARELIRQFGSAEEAIRRAGEVKRANYREALQKYAEFVILSKKLSRIDTEVPVELDLQKLRRQEPDVLALAALYKELGFSSLLRELGEVTTGGVAPGDLLRPEGAMAPPVVEKTDYAQLASAAEFREYLEKLPTKAPLAVWLTLDADGREAEGFGTRVVGIEVSAKAGEGRAVWVDPDGDALKALAPVLADKKRAKIVHDPKLFQVLTGDLQPGPLRTERVANIEHATQLYSYLLRPTTANHNFADVVMRQFNATLGGGPGERADYLQRLGPMLRAQVEQQELTRAYEEIDLPLAPVLADMERIGIRVDPKVLDAMSQSMEKEVRRLEKEIWELAGAEFNVNSPLQLAEVLFDKLGLEVAAKRGRGKTRSTAVEILQELSAKHAVPAKIIEYREFSKLKSTYVDALPKLIHPVTGRLHTSMSQTGTATGRLSSSDPNLQNIPIRTELGRQIRAAFVADKGKIMMSADYSQIELRIMAHFSGDKVLIEAFRAGEDIHARTAQEVFGVGPLLQTGEHRRAAKAINFGIIYGLSPFGLAQQLNIEQKEAAQFINAYFARYRGVKEYLEKVIADTRASGMTRTLFGRMRPMPEINSPQVQLRNFAERTALNSPLQGTAADLIKLAMIKIDERLRTDKFEAKMILQVHDELVFEAPPDEKDELEELVKAEMEGVWKLAVPLVVEIGVGPNWRDLD